MSSTGPFEPTEGSASSFSNVEDDSRTATSGLYKAAVACEVGDRVGQYLLERRIGKGGMGEVFAARHVETDEVVALKTLANTHPLHRYRFKREFRSLADVEHPHLIRLGELVIPETGASFFTMELLEGQSFVDWVRGPIERRSLPDLPRLEAALRQLVEGIECLHAHQCVHRDLKPSNVMITDSGRVVILDFGVVAELSDLDHGVTHDGQVLGTPAYMAPEQATGGRPGTAADYYAVGVMLYQCLTGQAPFSGSALQMLVDKQFDEAPDPGLLIEVIPARLRDLCVQLLHRDPVQRPTGPEVLVRLGSGGEPPKRRWNADTPAFVGRERELELLRQAFADVREQQRAVVVHVRGRSGHGKSALVRQFLAEVQREGEAVVVLRGRCRERETVPYKGVDAVIDALAVYLRHLPPDAAQALRPRHVGALARVFPVLDEIWTFDAQELTGLAPNEARSAGWAGLREILTRVASLCRLVVLIDDFQWADPDSAAILQATTRQPDAPGMLLLVATRDTGSSQVLDWLDAEDDSGSEPVRKVRRVELGPLTESEARELAMTLLRAHADPALPFEPGSLRTRAEAVALRCGGSPFFIGQMVLGGETSGDADLDQIVVHRLMQLDERARQLLEVVAVAGGPLPRSLAMELSELTNPEQVDELCGLGMLVRSEHEDRVEAAHDRIRELTLASLDPEQRRKLHWAIGEGLLARSGPNPAGDEIFSIADHLDTGLPPVESLSTDRRLDLARLAQVAGERALASTAWASARRYLGLGHRLIEPWLAEVRRGTGPRELSLAIEFGRAQAEAMVGSELADAAFEDLLTWTLSPAELGQIVDRRVSILTFTNRFDDAVAQGIAGLARLGTRLPRAPSILRGVASILLGWWTLGRLDLDALQALPAIRDERAQARLEVLIQLSTAAFYANPVLAFVLIGRMNRLIHRFGYHGAACRALAMLAMSVGIVGNARKAGDMCDRALALAELRATHPIAHVYARINARYIVGPNTHPLPGLLADIETLHQDACDYGMLSEAGTIAVVGGDYHLETSASLPEILAMLGRFEARNPGFGSALYRQIGKVVQVSVESLITGVEPVSADELGDEIAPLTRCFAVAKHLISLALRGDYARASELMDEIADTYERLLIGMIHIPRCAMFFAILEARRCPRARGRARRSSLRRLRRHVAVTRRWAKNCPENFGAMADIAAGELAVALGDSELATECYERARKAAAELGKRHLVGLACTRLARLAHVRGHDVTADAAFAAGLVAYEGWGAKALATRLRERGLEGL